MRRLQLLFLIFLFSFQISEAQEFRLKFKNQSMDKIVSVLDADLSYDSEALSHYRLTVDRSFRSVDEALAFVLSKVPYTYRKIGGVYVILPEVVKKVPVIRPQPRQPLSLPIVKMYDISEIIISADALKYSAYKGDYSAELHLDAHFSKYIPGSGDNAVFNLLRMMPGLRASNEPTNELIVWGSRSGESRMIFDGIRLFGMHTFNDNISSVNPYMVNDIVLRKGAYGAEIGNQCGAIAEVVSESPGYDRFSLKGSIGTHTANAYLNVPLKGRASIEAAYRRTYYDLYQNIDSIRPRYTFSDLNLKISGKAFEKDSYKFSFYGADDRFRYSTRGQGTHSLWGVNQNMQFGAAAQYRRIWNETTQSYFIVSYTYFHTVKDFSNLVQEFSARFSQTYQLKRNKLIAGIEAEHYWIDHQKLLKPTLYISDEFRYRNFSLKAGLRADLILRKVNFQPRISATLDFCRYFKVMLSSGIYNQYVTRIPQDSQTFRWGISDSFFSIHNVLGLSYTSHFGFYASAEAYYKKNYDAYRYIGNEIVQTDIDLSGMDLYVKYDFTKGSLFSSYSLSVIPGEEIAHELKLGTLLTIKPFVISANYVYGTGFSIFGVKRPYNRLDLSLTYRVRINSIQLQSGVSVLNVTNAKNLKYHETRPETNDIFSLYSHSTPITPMAFIEILW